MVRTPNISSILYTPNDAPAEAAQVQRFLREELAKISAAISALAAGHIDKSYAFPAKPRDGDVRYFDGVLANPGGGKGFYYYDADAAVWVQLG